MISRRVRDGVLVALLTLAPSYAWAQQAQRARVAIDTNAEVDEALSAGNDPATGAIFDSFISVGLGSHVEAMFRPFLQRRTNGDWNGQIWLAALRYERPGPVAVRVEGGLIPSPIGLANLTLRPNLNPTIAQPSSLFQPLPLPGAGTPRTTLLGAVYAYGGSMTISGAHWDSRIALIDTSPLRTRQIYGEYNPPRFANMVAGAGITPFVGFRFGASVTHGGWQRAGESALITTDRDATIVTLESTFAYRYTDLAAEWVRDTMESSVGDLTAHGWYVQGQQTLTPRWFAAARVERMTAPGSGEFATALDTHFTGTEEVVGYRLTREITIRAGHRARRTFGRADFDHVAEASLAWWRRWE